MAYILLLRYWHISISTLHIIHIILVILGTHFGIDLMHRKAEVKDIITDVINSMSDDEEEGEGEDAEDNAEGGDDADKDGDEDDD